MEDILAHHELALSEYIIAEVNRKLTERFDFRVADVRDVRRFLQDQSVIVEAE